MAGDIWSQIYSALDLELKKLNAVSICTEHLYPACQANLDFLKGGDHLLYKVLKDKYHVGVTPITIGRSYSDDDREEIWYSEFAPKAGSRLLHMTKTKKCPFCSACFGREQCFAPQAGY